MLAHVAFGLTHEEIGRSLAISIKTIKEHGANLQRKLNAPDRTAAAVMAVRAGLVEAARGHSRCRVLSHEQADRTREPVP